MIKLYHVKRCIVKESLTIKSLLMERFKELELSSKQVSLLAIDKKQYISESALCRYLKGGNVKGTLSQENILFLCDEYKIDLQLIVRKKS